MSYRRSSCGGRMAVLWIKLEISLVENPPALLDPDDICYYAREYTSHGGFSASEANQLVSNFKKKPSTRNTYQWNHKVRAVCQFARELESVLPPDSTLCFIPTS